MCDSNDDLQAGKDQKKIEVILERYHKNVLDRSYFLINVIFAFLGVYALVLSALFFPQFPTSLFSVSNNSIPSSQVDSSITYSLIPLLISIASITMAIIVLFRSFYMGNMDFESKFNIIVGPTKGSLTQYGVIPSMNDDFSIHLKNGKELMNRNKKLFVKTYDLMKYNDHSILFIFCSLSFFFCFLFLFKNSLLSLILFFILITIFIKSLDWLYTYQETRKRQR